MWKMWSDSKQPLKSNLSKFGVEHSVVSEETKQLQRDFFLKLNCLEHNLQKIKMS